MRIICSLFKKKGRNGRTNIGDRQRLAGLGRKEGSERKDFRRVASELDLATHERRHHKGGIAVDEELFRDLPRHLDAEVGVVEMTFLGIRELCNSTAQCAGKR